MLKGFVGDPTQKKKKYRKAGIAGQIPSCKGRYGPTCKRSRYIPSTNDGVFNYGAYYNQKMREQDMLNMNTTLSYLLINKLMKGEENNRNAVDANDVIDYRAAANQQMREMTEALQAQNQTTDQIAQQLQQYQANINQNLADMLEVHQESVNDILTNIRNGNNQVDLRLQNVENAVDNGFAGVDIDIRNLRNTTNDINRNLAPLRDVDLGKLNRDVESIRRGVDLSSYRQLEARRGYQWSRDETYQNMASDVRRDLGIQQDYSFLEDDEIEALQAENSRLEQEDEEMNNLRRRVREFIGD